MRPRRLRATPSGSWLIRIRENLRHLLAPEGLSAASANGTPLHLLKLDRSGRAGRAQTLSLLAHAGIIGAVLLLATQTPPQKAASFWQSVTSIDRLTYAPPETGQTIGKPSLGRRSGGGEENRVPATRGFLAPNSSIPLAPPRLPDNKEHALSVPAAVLDPQAPLIVTSVTTIGLPWMPNDNNSPGPGKDHGIGAGTHGGMGDNDGPGAGAGEDSGPYANGLTLPACSFCPLPVYTDEARQVKMQGTVTLRVLVTAEGKAADIRVVRGVGYGLEERAVQTVRAWKFTPARDTTRRALAAWVTIEVVFRLF
jgi:protein TonB